MERHKGGVDYLSIHVCRLALPVVDSLGVDSVVQLVSAPTPQHNLGDGTHTGMEHTQVVSIIRLSVITIVLLAVTLLSSGH